MATKEALRKLRQKFHLGEYRKNKPSKPKRTRNKRTKRGVQFMAKRRRSTKRSGNSFGGNKLMNGFIQPKGILAKALMGVAISEISDSFAPQMLPYQGVILAGIVGGIPAAAGAFGVNTLQGKNVSKTSNVSAYGNY